MIIDDVNDFNIRNKPNRYLTRSPVNIIPTTCRFDWNLEMIIQRFIDVS